MVEPTFNCCTVPNSWISRGAIPNSWLKSFRISLLIKALSHPQWDTPGRISGIGCIDRPIQPVWQ